MQSFERARQDGDQSSAGMLEFCGFESPASRKDPATQLVFSFLRGHACVVAHPRHIVALEKSRFAQRVRDDSVFCEAECHNEDVSMFRSMPMFRRNSASAIVVPQALDAPADPMITLRPLRMRDEREWSTLRWKNNDWLSPWQSGDPMHERAMSFRGWIARQREGERQGTGVIFAIEYDATIVGQISLGAISYGSMRTGIVGYWVDHDHAGLGIAPMAVAVLADWAIFAPHGPRLHRLEIAILPENLRSRRVVEKLQAHYEGIRPSYMFINGRWRDHITYALLAEDVREGFVNRLVRRHTDGSQRKTS